MYFEVDGNKKYMVIDGVEKRDISEYEIKMLKKNQISPFLKMDVKHIDNKVMYYYDVTSMSGISETYSLSKIRWDDVAVICEGIELMANKIEEYMLDIESVKISREYIFLDLSEKKIYFTYYPKELCDENDKEKGIHSQLKEFFEYILEKFDHDADKEHIPQIYEIYRHIIQKNYNLKTMSDFIRQPDNDLYTESLYRAGSYGDDNLYKPDNADAGIYENNAGEYLKADCSAKKRAFNENKEDSGKEIKKSIVKNANDIKGKNDINIISEIKNNKIVKAAAVIIGFVGVICIIMADMLPFKVNNMAALVMIGIGVLLFEYARDKKI